MERLGRKSDSGVFTVKETFPAMQQRLTHASGRESRKRFMATKALLLRSESLTTVGNKFEKKDRGCSGAVESDCRAKVSRGVFKGAGRDVAKEPNAGGAVSFKKKKEAQEARCAGAVVHGWVRRGRRFGPRSGAR